jgi:hypothetical protein
MLSYKQLFIYNNLLDHRLKNKMIKKQCNYFFLYSINLINSIKTYQMLIILVKTLIHHQIFILRDLGIFRAFDILKNKSLGNCLLKLSVQQN